MSDFLQMRRNTEECQSQLALENGCLAPVLPHPSCQRPILARASQILAEGIRCSRHRDERPIDLYA